MGVLQGNGLSSCAASSWMLSVNTRLDQPWSSSLRAFDARSAACCHLARGFLIEKSTAQALPVLQQINASELKASHESAHAIVLVGVDPRGFAAAPSDPPFKYKKAAPSLLQTTSSQPPFHFSKHPYPLHLIAKMASAESDLVRCYDN